MSLNPGLNINLILAGLNINLILTVMTQIIVISGLCLKAGEFILSIKMSIVP